MNKFYEAPEIELVMLDRTDVVCTSDSGDNGTGGMPDPETMAALGVE